MTHDLLQAPALARLGAPFVVQVAATPLPDARLLAGNDALAASFGWPQGWQDTLLGVISGNAAPSWGEPLASRYGGHQFGVWAGQLGDGRALLIGEAGLGGARVELQLKGGGQTPFSRMGDGRAVLRSSVREYLGCEAMHALGIPTTRALSLVVSSEPVWREREERAAVLCRSADSFLRFGHFELLYHKGEHAALSTLVDYAIGQHFPACKAAPVPALAMFAEVARRSAELAALWQSVGFCHGVLNTDNMSLTGLTLDYGPFGFLDATRLDYVCNHSDSSGRYAYARQSDVVLWNLYCFASSLLPLATEDALREVLDAWPDLYQAAFLARMREKLGLLAGQDEDAVLVAELLSWMDRLGADFTLTFRLLGEYDPARDAAAHFAGAGFVPDAGVRAWLSRYAHRLVYEAQPADARRAAMRRANPRLVLRNHLAEQAIRAAEAGDASVLERLSRALSRPFDDDAEFDDLSALPPAWAASLQLSCSS
ncbi:protein adenylyltransferase SelO [Crenobacter caeni]|uniref:Protein nucleotidyltransferase YdiU n=1 Tax=Crenobacter caeni TaxID=2705474 RepID=A0A6B2KUL4_9NEIS|nr:YdiU family protein [Crenobacter caeni]NDV13922.1 YdiU family protein [Crenobacter caeni]